MEILLMRLLVLTTYYPPEACAACIRIEHITRRIVENKIADVKVVVFNPLMEKTPEMENMSNHQGITRYHRSGIPARLFLPQSLNPFVFFYWAFITIREIRRFHPDLLLSSAPPFGPVIPAGLIASIFHKEYILDYRDDLTAIISHEAKRRGFFSRWLLLLLNNIVSSIFRIVLRNAALVSVANDALKDIVYSLNQNTVIVPNGVDFKEIEDIRLSHDDSEVLKRWLCGRRPEAILVHVSDLDVPYYQPEIFLDSVRFLVHEGYDVRFFIVGDGNRRGLIEDRIREMGLGDTVVMTGRLPHRDVISLLLTADAATYALSPEDPQSHHAIGAKMYEYLGCGLPVLAVGDDSSAAGHFIISVGAGVYVRWGDIGTLPAAMKEVLQNNVYRDTLKRMMPVFIERYDRDIGADRLIDRLKKMPGISHE